MDHIIPNHKFLSTTELGTKKRQPPFSERSRPCVKKTTKPNALLQKKSKQIRRLKTKTTTKLQSKVEVFILQT